MSRLFTNKLLVALLAAALVIAGAATRWKADRDEAALNRQQFEASKDRIARAGGYDAGRISETIRRMPR